MAGAGGKLPTHGVNKGGRSTKATSKSTKVPRSNTSGHGNQ